MGREGGEVKASGKGEGAWGGGWGGEEGRREKGERLSSFSLTLTPVGFYRNQNTYENNYSQNCIAISNLNQL